jgi:hypothetical protein
LFNNSDAYIPREGNVIRAWIQTRKYTGKEGKMKGTGKVALRGKVFSGFAKEARVNGCGNHVCKPFLLLIISTL